MPDQGGGEERGRSKHCCSSSDMNTITCTHSIIVILCDKIKEPNERLRRDKTEDITELSLFQYVILEHDPRSCLAAEWVNGEVREWVNGEVREWVNGEPASWQPPNSDHHFG